MRKKNKKLYFSDVFDFFKLSYSIGIDLLFEKIHLNKGKRNIIKKY